MGHQNSKEWLYSAIDAEDMDLINKILYVNYLLFKFYLKKQPTWVNQPMTKDCNQFQLIFVLNFI